MFPEDPQTAYSSLRNLSQSELRLSGSKGQREKRFGYDTFQIRFDNCVYPCFEISSKSNYFLNPISYYLNEYASAQFLIKFLIRHQKYLETIQVALKKQVSTAVFIEEIILYAHKHNVVTMIQSAIKQEGKQQHLITIVLLYSFIPQSISYLDHPL